MAIYVRNSTPNPVWVAIRYYNPGCSGDLAKRGWYYIPSGRTQVVYGSGFNHRFFRFYADDEFGNVWSGNDYAVTPSSVDFDLCWIANCPAGLGCENLGYRDPGYFDASPPVIPVNRTINLVLSSSRKRKRLKNTIIALPTKRGVKNRPKRPRRVINKLKNQVKSKSGHKRMNLIQKRKTIR